MSDRFQGLAIALLVSAPCGSLGCSTSGSGEPSAGGGPDNDARSTVPAVHRATTPACAQPRPAGRPGRGCDLYLLDGGDCQSDQDCDSGSNGRCNCTPIGATANSEDLCTYDGCTSDNDCPGTVCHCREDPPSIFWGTQTFCFPQGNCRQDSDCGPGGYCSPSQRPGCGYDSWYGFFCHTAGDECMNDGDCSQANAYCAFNSTTSHWMCATGQCPDA